MLDKDFVWDHSLYNTENLSQSGLKARYIHFQGVMREHGDISLAAGTLAEASYRLLDEKSRMDLMEEPNA